MNDEFSNGEDKDFLEYVLKKLVDNPDSIEVVRTVDERGVLLTVRTHPDDMGKVVGKGGQTAKALRVLLRIIGTKSKARVNMKVENPKEEE